jgi:hypothetical protein
MKNIVFVLLTLFYGDDCFSQLKGEFISTSKDYFSSKLCLTDSAKFIFRQLMSRRENRLFFEVGKYEIVNDTLKLHINSCGSHYNSLVNCDYIKIAIVDKSCLYFLNENELVYLKFKKRKNECNSYH